MVAPGTSRPSSVVTTRAMLLPDSPPGRPQPRSRSSIVVGSRSGILSSAAWTTRAVRSSGRKSLSEPLLARPMGERAAETITASGMENSGYSWVTVSRHPSPRPCSGLPRRAGRARASSCSTLSLTNLRRRRAGSTREASSTPSRAATSVSADAPPSLPAPLHARRRTIADEVVAPQRNRSARPGPGSRRPSARAGRRAGRAGRASGRTAARPRRPHARGRPGRTRAARPSASTSAASRSATKSPSAPSSASRVRK